MRWAAVLVAGLLASAGAARAEDADFKDWWAVCDNVRACTAYGFPPDAEEGAVLRLRREAEAGATVDLDVNIGPDPAKGVSGSLSLAVDGKVVARTGPPEGADDEYRRWPVAEGDTPVVLVALLRGHALEARDGERTVATLSLAGLSATLRWIDDRQKRAGGVTALVAKGAAPASVVPAPPRAPLIRAARPVSQAGLTDTPSSAVKAALKPLDCQADPPDGPTSNRLAPGVVLWVVPCWVGAYQISSALVLADERGGHARLVDLGNERNALSSAMATNAEFSTDDQKLYAYAKGRGLADCGESTTHAWTGKGFVLVERTELPVCRMLPEEFWVTTYRTRDR
jgi:hypothetical protein